MAVHEASQANASEVRRWLVALTFTAVRNFYRNFYRTGRNGVEAVSTLQHCSLRLPS